MTRFAATATIALTIVAVLGMVLWTPVTAVQVTDENGNTIACVRTAPGDPVVLTFTHSMYGGDVTEIWTVGDGGLDRVRILTDNAASAEYYAWDGQVERAGQRFEVVTQPLHEPALLVRVDQIGRHRLTIGDRNIDLMAMVDTTAQVRIEPGQQPFWRGRAC